MSEPKGAENNKTSTTKKPGGVTGKGFLPGHSGNPGGRPKRLPITEIYQKILDSAENQEQIEAAILKTVLAGRMGSVLTLKEMAERVEGKVTQPVEVNGELTLTLSERLKKARERRASKQ